MPHMFADVRADLIYAFRTIRRTPGVAITAIVSLALGIGVNALVFSVVNGLVLRPLPDVANPDRVVFVQTAHGPGQSYPNYIDIRDRTTAFDALGGYRVAPMSVETGSTGAQPRRAWGYLVTGNYFDLLGVRPAVGRFFHAQDDMHPGEAPLAVLSYDEWMAHFDGSPSIVGTTIRLNTFPFTIIGVAPRGFFGTEVFFRPAIWVPTMMTSEIEPGNNWITRRATFNMWMIGRLKPGTTVPQAEANLNAIAADLGRTYPWPNKGMVLRLTRPGLVGSLLRSPVEAFGAAVLGLAALVLIAACANLAGLLLARGADRQREMAIRLSIGAGRGRLLRQLLTESVVLALVGGGVGIAAAAVLARALAAWQIPVTIPMRLDVAVDWRVLLFAFAVALLSGILFGAAPARFASATDPNLSLKGSGSSNRGARRWTLRDALIPVQVAVCFVLVTASVVSVQGLQRALSLPLGFDPSGVTTASFDLGLAGYDKARGQAFQQRMQEETSRIPGVTSAAFSNSMPLSLDQSHNSVYRVGAAAGDPEAANAVVYSVSPGFLRTIGMPLLSGRDFDARDSATSPEVSIVNETFAKQVFKSTNPMGQHFRFGPGGPLIEVVGVVADGKYENLGEAPTPAAFNPETQWYNSTTVLSVRSSLPEGETAAAVRQVAARLDPALPLYDVESAQEMTWISLLPSKVAAIALGVFGVLAMLLAATGLYGLVAYAVSRRAREIAIRMAVGASWRAVLSTVLGRTTLLIVVGALVGAGLALAALRVLSSVLFGVASSDVRALGIVALMMASVGLVSCWGPTLRALRLDPAVILKAE
jgi:predicted permease